MLIHVFLNENRALLELMWKNDNITGRMRLACQIAKAVIQAFIIFNTYCFSMATVVTRARLIVTL
jgi:hypothetical protein